MIDTQRLPAGFIYLLFQICVLWVQYSVILVCSLFPVFYWITVGIELLLLIFTLCDINFFFLRKRHKAKLSLLLAIVVAVLRIWIVIITKVIFTLQGGKSFQFRVKTVELQSYSLLSKILYIFFLPVVAKKIFCSFPLKKSFSTSHLIFHRISGGKFIWCS